MCLILFAWQSHPRYPLVLAANRDEFHDRPTAAAGFWSDAPQILAGRDMQAGGTWLGISRDGRFSAISNYREPMHRSSSEEHSRGHLVRDYLLDERPPSQCARALQASGARYRGFNILAGDPESLYYVSNRLERPAEVASGVHGLSNHLLDTDWPKVHRGTALLETLLQNETLEAEPLLGLLADRDTAEPTPLPAETLRQEPERMISKIFICSPVYGTRSSTVVLLDEHGKVSFTERQYDAGGRPRDTVHHEFSI